MVFVPTTLFKDTPCPVGDACELLNCIFAHVTPTNATAADSAVTTATTRTDRDSRVSIRTTGDAPDRAIESPAKRRKIIHDKLQDKPLSKAECIRNELAQARGQVAQQRKSETASSVPPGAALQTSTTRPVSPPVTSPRAKIAVPSQTPPSSRLQALMSEKPESLNPRVVTPSPESHGKRTVIVQHIHGDMSRLNRSLKTSAKPIDGVQPKQLQAYVLNDVVLIKLALTEEETIARESPGVYANVVRSRIAYFKKMKDEDWLRYLQKLLFPPRPVATDSLAIQKILAAVVAQPVKNLEDFLKRLVIKDTTPLERHGYIMTPPSAQAAEEQRAVAEEAGNWESCDRCLSRFRIFPERNPETGLLTSHGPCTYHWGRKVYSTRQKTDAYTGNGSPTYRCCGQDAGAPGCTTHPEHVYKVSASSRLAAVMPFMITPKNEEPLLQTPVSTPVVGVVFDCEMAYTTNGTELVRLTAINFRDAHPLLDVLVRPLGAVIDFNTRFSGIKAAMYTTTAPYDDNAPTGELRLVDNPAKARQLLLRYLTDDTPLMGHALENDLNAVRLCHKALIDTVVLYPHPKGLPIRFSLKMLTKDHLGKHIQQGGSEGHDSFEDAAATRDLIAKKLVRDFGLLKC